MVSGWSTSVGGTLTATSPEVICGEKLKSGWWSDNVNCGNGGGTTAAEQLANIKSDCCYTVKVGC